MKKLLMLLGVASMLASPVWAFNTQFLNQSPIEYYSDEDWQLFLVAQTEALNKAANGVKVSWKNPKSGSWGYFIPVNRSMQNGVVCRDLKISNNANHRTDEATMTYCKFNDTWKVI